MCSFVYCSFVDNPFSEEFMIDTTGIDEVFKRLEETDKLKQQAIEQLLDVRRQIDEKLARLGYVEGGTSQGLSPKSGPRKRVRRTKAEIEAARQVELKTKQLPGEHETKSRTTKGSGAHG
jgi:hypothetical protein